MTPLIRSPLPPILKTLLGSARPTLLLTGAAAVYELSLRYAAEIGRRRLVVYLDGANRFDPYVLTHYAEAHDFSAETLLDSVFVRRAFTCYQMVEMVARLPIERLRQRRGVVIVAGPCTTFDDESLTERTARRLLGALVGDLTAVSRVPIPLLIVQPTDGRQSRRRAWLSQLRRLGAEGQEWVLPGGTPGAAPSRPRR